MMNGKGGEKVRPKHYSPAVRMAIVSFLICGLLFPLFVTGLAQVLMPYQANGEIVQLHGRNIGSNLIDNNFTLPIFFHARPVNASGSGVDPDITIQDAYSQIPRIHNATGIPESSLQQIVDSNEEGMYWIFGSPYVNVMNLDLQLIKQYPTDYSGFPRS